MSYSSFWGFCGLAILLLLHGIYLLPAGKRIDALQELKKRNRRLWITMTVTIVPCAPFVEPSEIGRASCRERV